MPSMEQHSTEVALNVKTAGLLLEAFVESLKDCFETMLGAEVQPVEREEGWSCGDYSAMASLGLVGNFDAVFILGFSEVSALSAVSAMMQGMEPESTDEVCDGIGEIANIVAGGAKTRLDGTNYHFTLSIPSVVLGQALQLKSNQNPVVFHKHFTFGEDGRLMMTLLMAKGTSENKA